jgi:hypothetical protein
MIIKDVNGGRLELTKTRLLESYGAHALPRYLELSDLRASHIGKLDDVVITRIDKLSSGNSMSIAYEPKKHTIGCRTFSPAAFAKILKAAGVVRKTDKKRKPAKKGKK